MTNGSTNVLLIICGVVLLGWAGSWCGARVVSAVVGVVFLALATADWVAGDGGSAAGLVPIDAVAPVLDTMIGARSACWPRW